MPKRILYILPQPFLLSRGSSFRAYATIKAIIKAGYQVDLLCYPLGEAPVVLKQSADCRIFRSASLVPVSSVKVGPSIKKIYLDLFLYLKAKSLIASNQYQLIHGVEEAGLMAHRLARKCKLPYIYDMHSWMSQQIEEGGFSFSTKLLSKFKNLENAAIADSAAVITVGETMTEIVNQQLGENKAYTLHDCPLSFDIEPEQKLKDQIIKDYFSDDSKKILYTGNFHKYQGIDLLLQAVSSLKKSLQAGQKFKLLLVGGGAGDKANIAKYKSEAEQLGIAGEVVFCGEYPAETMPVFMSKSDALVSPRSQGNNVPLKVYTYLSSGSLMVATNIESHVQVLNMSNAVLADPDSNSFADALSFALFEISEEEKSQIIEAAESIGIAQQVAEFEDVVENSYSASLLAT